MSQRRTDRRLTRGAGHKAKMLGEAEQALALHEDGLTLQEIADRLGLSHKTQASRRILLALQHRGPSQEAVDAYRATQVARTEVALAQLEEGCAAGDPQSHSARVKNEALLASLLGTAAPVKTELSGSGRLVISLDEIARVAEANAACSTPPNDSGGSSS